MGVMGMKWHMALSHTNEWEVEVGIGIPRVTWWAPSSAVCLPNGLYFCQSCALISCSAVQLC